MGRKFLYILGASGSGKTTLAKKLETLDPTKYHKVLQCTTRPPRLGEVDGVDYHFLTNSQYDELCTRGETGYRDFFESVEKQFAPARYGGTYDELDIDKWNIVVSCIEGFLSGATDFGDEEVVLLHILCNGNTFIERDGRDASTEERYNLAVIQPFKDHFEENLIRINDNEIAYYEITVDALRALNDEATLTFINSICQ